jgi:RNA polymerase sigma factor (sigma-70 family)
VQTFLLAWQASGEAEDFRHLWVLVSSAVEHDAATVLRRSGVRDPGAVDESVSLVMDHLRRLPLGTVRRFEATRHTHGDGATLYVRWLSRRRALDIVRQRRRQVRTFTDIAATEGRDPERSVPDDRQASADDSAALLRQALGQLDPRSRQVLEWLLAGWTQARISRELGVCEGTVTRIRQKSLDHLRKALNGQPAAGGPSPGDA